MDVKTESVLVQNLCVPCGCRCRYCLLSWDGTPVGVGWERSLAFFRRFRDRLRAARPEIPVQFAFGYAMEHPDLPAALAQLRELGSPHNEYFQCDGMRLRNPEECRELAALLAREGIKKLNFTLYGLEDYHDRFAARAGDFAAILRMMAVAGEAGLSVSCGIPLTLESLPQISELVELLQSRKFVKRVFLFVPHEEGRGKQIAPIRVTTSALLELPQPLQELLNRKIFRPEGEWLTTGAFVPETRRSLLLSLREDNIERLERMEPLALLRALEALDEQYYAAFPSFEALAERYGDPAGEKLYRQRDLFAHYRSRYAAEFGIHPYDVTDERQSGSRRY